MRASVRTSANGRPSLRAKRARSRSRLIRDSASAIRGGTMERKSVETIRWVIIPSITTTYRPMFTLRFKASAIRAADRGAGAPDRLGLRVVTALDLPLDRPHPAHPLLQLLLGVAVGREDRL